MVVISRPAARKAGVRQEWKGLPSIWTVQAPQSPWSQPFSDNVMRIMEPGKRYEIEIAIPADHVCGTNWYHPHAHGSAGVQIASGVAGALIIEGDFEDVPEIAAAQERLLVLTESVFDSFGTIENFETLFPETAARFLAVNGVREPPITMRPGEGLC